MNSALMLHKHAGPAVAGNYWLGAITGALATSGMLVVGAGLLSPIPASFRATAFVLVVVLLALHLSRVLCLSLPERRYQIPRETFNGSAPRGAFRFAAELGLGFRTYVSAVSPYALVAALLLVSQASLADMLVAALAAAIGFGTGRSRIVVGHVLRRSVAVEHPAGWLRLADAVALAGLAALGLRAF